MTDESYNPLTPEQMNSLTEDEKRIINELARAKQAVARTRHVVPVDEEAEEDTEQAAARRAVMNALRDAAPILMRFRQGARRKSRGTRKTRRGKSRRSRSRRV